MATWIAHLGWEVLCDCGQFVSYSQNHHQQSVLVCGWAMTLIRRVAGQVPQMA